MTSALPLVRLFCLVADVQKNNGLVAVVDASGLLTAEDMKAAKSVGVDLDQLLVGQPADNKELSELTGMLARSGALDLVVVVGCGEKKDQVVNEMQANSVPAGNNEKIEIFRDEETASVELVAHRGIGEPWRIRRLARVAIEVSNFITESKTPLPRWFQALYVIGKIEKLYDYKGTLSVFWKERPTPADLQIIEAAWGRENEHLIQHSFPL